MEKDINLIIEVDPNEAELLLRLIEVLLKEWYIARHEQDEQLQTIIDLAHAKEAAKHPALPAASATPEASADT